MRYVHLSVTEANNLIRVLKRIENRLSVIYHSKDVYLMRKEIADLDDDIRRYREELEYTFEVRQHMEKELKGSRNVDTIGVNEKND